MSDTETPADVCYRHPDRPSLIRCQRCGRTICPACQTQAAVGVQCPECVREGREAANANRAPRAARFARAVRGGAAAGRPIVTFTLIGLNLVVFGLQWLTGQALTQAWIYAPALTASEPWRMVTSAFLHSPSFVLHIVFNMFALFSFGPALEQLLGRGRFAALYLISAFGGSVAVLLLGEYGQGVLGASGAVFGLMGAFLIIQRRLGGDVLQIAVIVAINLALGFFVSGISWQAHVGGLIAGAAVAAVYVATRTRAQRGVQIAGVAGIAVLLVIISVARVAVGWV
jgi:membrane associated rhomboid family serine protease